MIIEKFNFIDGTAILMIQLRLGESNISCLKSRMADSGCLCSVDTDLLSLSRSRLLGLNRGGLLGLSLLLERLAVVGRCLIELVLHGVERGQDRLGLGLLGR